MKNNLYKIVFNDGKVKMLVATDLSYEECEKLMQKQEKPELYHIVEIADDFNYYSFVLNDVERIYYTYVSNDSEQEILEWAEKFGFINYDDFSKCTDIRKIPQEEVDSRNKNLYKEWWERREKRKLSGEDVSFDLIPPTIGEVQLN
ncbi:hypothetical protein SAMN05443270_3469 [Lacrimispora sphenoides]|uniref:hypothetical protein n=1 Tax=Lacrimispora sphenoides TaxID=29370 RepID=UPI0008BAB4A1|nr:hypothetical protein [Lacrimispora sphenoides]SEU22317.1 hypothetical protein SAMN05443270_3469 [Lacrimispora sphenoides]